MASVSGRKRGLHVGDFTRRGPGRGGEDLSDGFCKREIHLWASGLSAPILESASNRIIFPPDPPSQRYAHGMMECTRRSWLVWESKSPFSSKKSPRPLNAGSDPSPLLPMLGLVGVVQGFQIVFKKLFGALRGSGMADLGSSMGIVGFSSSGFGADGRTAPGDFLCFSAFLLIEALFRRRRAGRARVQVILHAKVLRRVQRGRKDEGGGGSGRGVWCTEMRKRMPILVAMC